MNLIIVLTLGLAIFFTACESATFTVVNHCPFTIWPGTLTGGGKPQLSSTGFELSQGASVNIDAPISWSGRFWARTGCSADATGRLTCASADCGSGQVACNGAGAIPPATLVELTLNGDGGLDFYDVSLVDGFNLPVTLAPTNGCPSTACPVDVNAVCPVELAINVSGGIVGCKSACLAFGSPQFCCSGAFATPDTCPPNQFSRIFKGLCPQAYSYAYDDRTSTFTCPGGPNYTVTFCP